MRYALEDEGYRVVEAEDGTTGLRCFADERPDLVLLDLRLPDRRGLDVCRELRAHSIVPIVIVTAQTDTHDLVAGLEAGADDYVTKPVVPKALAARIRALLRRAAWHDATSGGEHADAEPSRPGASNHQSGRSLVLGDLEILEDEAVVRRAGAIIDLTKTEFRLLCELAHNANLVLSRDQLLERVWGYDYLGDSRLVDAHVYRLRSKVERDPQNPVHIQTVRGLGYKLVP